MLCLLLLYQIVSYFFVGVKFDLGRLMTAFQNPDIAILPAFPKLFFLQQLPLLSFLYIFPVRYPTSF